MIPWRVRCAHGPADVIQTVNAAGNNCRREH